MESFESVRVWEIVCIESYLEIILLTYQRGSQTEQLQPAAQTYR